MEWMYDACLMGTFWVGGIIFGGMRRRREHFFRRIFLCTFLYAAGCAAALFLLQVAESDLRILAGFCMLILFHHTCWEDHWSVAAYDAVWAVASWQLLYGLWLGLSGSYPELGGGAWYCRAAGVLVLFGAGDLISV